MSDTAAKVSNIRTSRSATARVTSLVKAEFILLRRNKLVLFLIFAMPIFIFAPMVPMAIKGKLGANTTSMFLGLMMTSILIFGVFYTLVPTFVSRREELVLKRLRSGECSDKEIITGISLPVGLISAVLLLVLSVAAVVGLRQPLPVNALLVLIALLGGCLVFAGLSLATTVFTKNSEAAQLTSMPVMLISVLGASSLPMPDWATTLMQHTPLAPSIELTRLGWAGLTRDGAIVDFAGSFSQAVQPTLTLLAWILIGGWVARKYFRWEPRT